MNDLFLDQKSKKDQLLDWILSRRFTATHEVQAWGLQHYHCRAPRDAQELSKEGFIRRMTDQEKNYFAIFSKEGFWVPKDFKIYQNLEAA